MKSFPLSLFQSQKSGTRQLILPLDPLGIVVNGHWRLLLVPRRGCKTSCKSEKVRQVSLLLALLALLKALILLLCDHASHEGRERAEHPPGDGKEVWKAPCSEVCRFVSCFDQCLLMDSSFNLGGSRSREGTCKKNVQHEPDSFTCISPALSPSKSSTSAIVNDRGYRDLGRLKASLTGSLGKKDGLGGCIPQQH